MKSFNINDVRIRFGDLEIGPEDWLSTDVPLDSWSAQTERPTMCEWCRSHPRRYGGDARCWRCGHEHGCQVTGFMMHFGRLM